MARFEATTTVGAAAVAVSTYLADGANLPEWDGSLRRVEPIRGDESESRPVQWRAWMGFYGRELELVYTLESASETAVRWTVSGDRANGTVAVALAPDGADTTATYRIELVMTGFARLFDRGLDLALAGIGENTVRGLQRAAVGL